MKTKLLLLVSLCAISLGAWKVQAGNPETTIKCFMEINVPTEYDVINLHGELMYNIGPNAIVAGANDNAVYIGFNQSFGNVNISIYNGMGGLVYSTVVNTDVQQVFIIPFSGVASGSYTVELSSANGYAEGEFDKD